MNKTRAKQIKSAAINVIMSNNLTPGGLIEGDDINTGAEINQTYCKNCIEYNKQWEVCNIRTISPITGEEIKSDCNIKNKDYKCNDYKRQE